MIDAAEAAEIAELEKAQAAAGQGPGGQGNGAVQEQQPAEAAQQDQPQPEQQQAEPDDTEEIEVENRGRFVRASSLKAAEDRRKDAERARDEALAKYASDMARVEERLRAITETRREPEPKPAEIQIPDINQDPLGHFQAKDALKERTIAELQKRVDSFEQRTSQTDAMQKVGEEVTRLETEFSRTNTDYGEAMAHLRSTWEAEAAVAGVAPHVAIRARALEIAQLAARSNRNPAELGYQLAKARGYVKKAPANGNGQAQQQSGPNLETLARGIASSKSAGSAPGRAAPGTPTLEALLSMDDDEFVKSYVGRDNPKWRKVASGLAH